MTRPVYDIISGAAMPDEPIQMAFGVKQQFKTDAKKDGANLINWQPAPALPPPRPSTQYVLPQAPQPPASAQGSGRKTGSAPQPPSRLPPWAPSVASPPAHERPPSNNGRAKRAPPPGIRSAPARLCVCVPCAVCTFGCQADTPPVVSQLRFAMLDYQ